MQVTLQSPFGAILESEFAGQSILAIDRELIKDLLDQNLLLIFRGYALASDEHFVQFAQQLGPLLEWEFGAVLELKIQTDPANHIFSDGRVELHWDGAYVEDKPHYNLFQCINASANDEGGETLFVNALEVLNRASQMQRELWNNIVIDYVTEKKAHYGGTISEPLCSVNPYSQKQVIRYIEAFNEDNETMNPVRVSIHDFSQARSDQFLREFNQRLYQEDIMYRHTWTTGDYLIADNCSLLHGRSRFNTPYATRHIKRINIL